MRPGGHSRTGCYLVTPAPPPLFPARGRIRLVGERRNGLVARCRLGVLVRVLSGRVLARVLLAGLMLGRLVLVAPAAVGLLLATVGLLLAAVGLLLAAVAERAVSLVLVGTVVVRGPVVLAAVAVLAVSLVLVALVGVRLVLIGLVRVGRRVGLRVSVLGVPLVAVA